MRLVIQLVPNLDEFFFRGQQKTFCCFCCVFRPYTRLNYETPIRGYSQHPLKAQRWGRHTRACPSCLRQQVERKIFVMLNLRMQQPSHGEKKNYKPLSLNFSGSKQTSPYGKLQKCLGEALLLERIFFSLFL